MNAIRTEPVLISALVTAIVGFVARYGLRLDENLVLAVILAALGGTSIAARAQVTSPDTQNRIEGLHQFAVRVLEAKLAVAGQVTESD